MADPAAIAPLAQAIRDLVAWWSADRTPGSVIGGVAASLLGRARFTRDVDAVVLVDEERWDSFLASGEQFGFLPRLPDAVAFARQSRMLLVRHEPTSVDVDLSFGALPFEHEAVERATQQRVAGVEFPVLTPEDLLIMKAVAHRPQDLGDIEGVLVANPQLDRQRVRQWVEQFATALDAPEILGDLEALLGRYPPD